MTAQGNITAGGGCWGGMEAALWGYGSLSFVYSCFFHLVRLPPLPSPPTSLSHPLASPLLLLQRCCFPPSPRPLQALKGKLCSAARLLLLQPCKRGGGCVGGMMRATNNSVTSRLKQDIRLEPRLYDFGQDFGFVASVKIFIPLSSVNDKMLI